MVFENNYSDILTAILLKQCRLTVTIHVSEQFQPVHITHIQLKLEIKYISFLNFSPKMNGLFDNYILIRNIFVLWVYYYFFFLLPNDGNLYHISFLTLLKAEAISSDSEVRKDIMAFYPYLRCFDTHFSFRHFSFIYFLCQKSRKINTITIF